MFDLFKGSVCHSITSSSTSEFSGSSLLSSDLSSITRSSLSWKTILSEEQYDDMIDTAYGDNPESNPWKRIRNGKNLFRKDVKHLQKNNMVFQESEDLVIEDKSEDNKVEPENSDVEEEVIE